MDGITAVNQGANAAQAAVIDSRQSGSAAAQPAGWPPARGIGLGVKRGGLYAPGVEIGIVRGKATVQELQALARGYRAAEGRDKMTTNACFAAILVARRVRQIRVRLTIGPDIRKLDNRLAQRFT